MATAFCPVSLSSARCLRLLDNIHDLQEQLRDEHVRALHGFAVDAPTQDDELILVPVGAATTDCCVDASAKPASKSARDLGIASHGNRLLAFSPALPATLRRQRHSPLLMQAPSHHAAPPWGRSNTRGTSSSSGGGESRCGRIMDLGAVLGPSDEDDEPEGGEVPESEDRVGGEVPEPHELGGEVPTPAGFTKPAFFKRLTRSTSDFGVEHAMLRRSNRSISHFDDSVFDEIDERARIYERIRNRLFPPGASAHATVTTSILHEALEELGMSEISKEQVRQLLTEITEASANRFADAGLWTALKKFAGRMSGRSCSHFRTVTGEVTSILRRINSNLSGDAHDRMPFEAFCHALFDNGLKRNMSSECADLMDTVLEVLASATTIRLVADMTRLSMYELSAAPPKKGMMERMEPFFASLIIVNGLLLGVQSDEAWEGWHGWWYVEFVFVVAFTIELIARMYVVGWSQFFRGKEATSNAVDFLIVLSSLTETFMASAWSANLLRLMRLTRLTRLFRITRFAIFKEFTLMLAGLAGGVKTLGWAMVLLLLMIYVIALFMNNTVGKSEAVTAMFGEEGELYFSSVPRCMFLAFRCFTGECGDAQGRSIVAHLSMEFGFQFDLPYIMSSMVMNFGIFNLIIAVYIESTLDAAKSGHSPEQSREHIVQMANAIKKLLKRIIYLTRCLEAADASTDLSLFEKNAVMYKYEDCEEEVDISKEIFNRILRDPIVKSCMDALDVPVNRMHLFETLDADGSGSLLLTELVHGIVATRGEPRKSDTVACLLSIRKMQDLMNAQVDQIDLVRSELRQLYNQEDRKRSRAQMPLPRRDIDLASPDDEVSTEPPDVSAVELQPIGEPKHPLIRKLAEGIISL